MLPGTAHRYWAQWLLLGIALLILGALIGYSLYLEYSRVDALERDRLQVQARVIDENLGRQLQGANDALAGVRNEFPPPLNKSVAKAASRHLRALSNAMPGVRTMLLVDADGMVLAASRDELIGLSSSEREYFAVPRERPDPAVLYVSRPFTTTLGVFSINVVRVVTGSRGEFAGIISATLDPEYFAVLLNSVLYAPGMRSSIIHGDGRIVIEEPDRKDLAGMDLAKPGSRYTKHVESGKAANIFVAGNAYATGDERMSAWRTIRPVSLQMDKPLMVSVDRDMAGIFASWHRYAYALGGIFGALLLTTTLGLFFYQRRQMALDRIEASYEAERKRVEETLRESEERLRSIFEGALDGILVADRGTRKFLSGNPEICRMLGYTFEEIARIGISDIHPKQDLPRVMEQFERLLRGESQMAADIPVMRKDGSVFYADIKAAPIRIGGKDGLLGIFRDVTERKRVERELQRETELAQLLEQLARAANEAVSPEAAMEICLRRICEGGKWALGRIATFSPGLSQRKPDHSQWFCSEPARFDAFMRYSDSYEFMGRYSAFIHLVLRDQCPVWLPDLTVLDMAKLGRLAMAAEAGLKAAFAFPVIVMGEVAAFLEFFATETRGPDALLIEGTTGLASQFARMIERGKATEAQARLAAIIEHSNDAIIGRTVDGTVTSWNAAAERLFGYTAAEAIGRKMVEIHPPELHDEVAERRQLLVAGQPVANFETARITKDGRRIDVMLSASPIRDNNSGNIIGTAAIVRDITGRKQAENALRESERRYRGLFNNMLEGFAYCRMLFENGRPQDWVYVEVNPAFEQLTGLKNVVGKKVTEVIPGIRESNPTLFERYGRVAATGKPETFEIYVGALEEWFSVSAFCPEHGYFVAVFEIITERKAAEQKVRDYANNLRTLSRKLIEVQEDEHKRLARELHDQVGQVLTALKINLQVIQRQPAAAPVAPKIEECAQIADSALQQVRTLMLDLRPPQLDELGLAVALRTHAEQVLMPANLALHFSASAELPKTPPTIEITYFRIMQEALTNILRHAGAGNVWIELAVVGDGLELTVRDDGRGFDLAEAHRRAMDGGSIGLLSMEERAALADGRIEIRTAPGAGTTVRAMFSVQAATSKAGKA